MGTTLTLLQIESVQYVQLVVHFVHPALTAWNVVRDTIRKIHFVSRLVEMDTIFLMGSASNAQILLIVLFVLQLMSVSHVHQDTNFIRVNV